MRTDLPPIEIKFYNGTGGEDFRFDEYMMNATVTPEFLPAGIDNFGTEFSRVMFPRDAALSEQTLVDAVEIYFTPTVAMFNCSTVEIQFPREITLPLSLTSLDQVTDELIASPWVEIPCEPIQNFDLLTMECWLGLYFSYDEMNPALLIDFGSTNLVRVLHGLDGDSLVYEEPAKQVIYVPDPELIPIWVDPEVEYIPDDLTYVDGEFVNLYLIDIVGNKTIADIDLN